MSSYVEETLTKGETVLLTGKITLKKYWLNFLLAFPYAARGQSHDLSRFLADLGIGAVHVVPGAGQLGRRRFARFIWHIWHSMGLSATISSIVPLRNK
jgi:hypothetical protein